MEGPPWCLGFRATSRGPNYVEEGPWQSTRYLCHTAVEYVHFLHSSKHFCNRHLQGGRVGARESTGRVSQRMPIGTSTISSCSQGEPSRIPAGFWKEIWMLIGHIGSSWRLLAASLHSSTLAPLVMDMVIFRMIFFELFSFHHIHAPYPPFRLLMNLGKHPEETQGTIFIWLIDNGTKTNIKLLLLIVRGPHHGFRPFLHHILWNRCKSRNNH